MPKSADAFRTISEVAEWLETPAHVLRFWESKFSQVKPVKRAGGRRYYRPADMKLLGGIKKLLHNDGMTIKGVQKVLREEGVKHVAEQSQPLDEVTELEASEMAQDVPQADEAPASGTVLSFQRDETTSAVENPAPDAAAPSKGSKAPKPKTTSSAAKKTSKADTDAEPEPTEDDKSPAMPSFMHHREPSKEDATTKPASGSKQKSASGSKKAPEPALAQVDVPPDPDDSPAADPGALSALAGFKGAIPDKLARQLGELADRLRSAVHDRHS